MKQLKLQVTMVAIAVVVAIGGMIQLFHEEAVAQCQPCSILCVNSCETTGCCTNCAGVSSSCHNYCNECPQ